MNVFTKIRSNPAWKALLKLQEIRMDNNPWSDMTPFTREVFRSTLDLPKEE